MTNKQLLCICVFCHNFDDVYRFISRIKNKYMYHTYTNISTCIYVCHEPEKLKDYCRNSRKHVFIHNIDMLPNGIKLSIWVKLNYYCLHWSNI